MDELMEMFADVRADIDSEPFAHEAALAAAISATIPVTPGQGAGCPLVLGVLAVAVLFLAVLVAQIVMAVTP